MTTPTIITITPQRLPAIKKLLDEQGIWADNPDLMARVEFALGLLGTTADSYANACIALEELRHRNPQRNDTDAYLMRLAAYGLGYERKPAPSDWGIT